MLFCFEGAERRYLSTSLKPLEGQDACHEVNCSPQRFSWKVQLYDDVTSEPSPIHAGDAILLFHQELEGFFTVNPEDFEVFTPC